MFCKRLPYYRAIMEYSQFGDTETLAAKLKVSFYLLFKV